MKQISLTRTMLVIGVVVASAMFVSCADDGGEPSSAATAEAPAASSASPEVQGKLSLARDYEVAAGEMNITLKRVYEDQSKYCAGGTATEDLERCKEAITAEREAREAFLRALEDMHPAPTYRDEVDGLIESTRVVIDDLRQAEKAQDVTGVNAIFEEYSLSLEEFDTDVAAIRKALGLDATGF